MEISFAFGGHLRRPTGALFPLPLAGLFLPSFSLGFGKSKKQNVILVAIKLKINIRTDPSSLRGIASQNCKLLLKSFPCKGAPTSCGLTHITAQWQKRFFWFFLGT